jgi:hypothetical protein
VALPGTGDRLPYGQAGFTVRCLIAEARSSVQDGSPVPMLRTITGHGFLLVIEVAMRLRRSRATRRRGPRSGPTSGPENAWKPDGPGGVDDLCVPIEKVSHHENTENTCLPGVTASVISACNGLFCL